LRKVPHAKAAKLAKDQIDYPPSLKLWRGERLGPGQEGLGGSWSQCVMKKQGGFPRTGTGKGSLAKTQRRKGMNLIDYDYEDDDEDDLAVHGAQCALEKRRGSP
jgi:hypothetical protein